MPMLNVKRKSWSSVFVWKRLWLLLVLLLLMQTTSPALALDIGLENKIKAAYLINFMLYVEVKEKDNKVRHLCLYSKKKFGEFIHHLLAEKNKRYSNLDIRIGYIRVDKQIGRCHAVFISSVESQSINLMGFPKGILTIGEAPGFLLSGGMFKFFIEEDSVHFATNLDAINRSSVTLSSQLLKLARTPSNE